jgi:Bacterial Ig-like domain/Matrixin
VLYSATGNAWMNPEVITISFMPDGTNLGGPVSNLQSTFNKNANLAGKWEQQFLQAAQAWAAQTNINFVVVPDDGAPMGGGSYQEGDPGMGDIRIGGYNFGTSTLAWSYQPPPVNNYSLAGDIEINTGMPFNIGTTYDMFTVAAHELGHALGLGQSSGSSASIMYPTYTGRKTALTADDIAGIRSIYGGARAPDVYGGLNTSFATAANLDGLVDPNALTGLAYNLDLNTIGDAEFFSVDAPAGTNGPMEVSVQSQGLSLLSPLVTVYAGSSLSNGTLNASALAVVRASSNSTVSGSYAVVGSASGLGLDGTTLTVTIPNAVAGQRYYIEVQGADSTVFSTGDYALGLSFNGTTPPIEPSPIVAYANGTPLHSGGGSAQQGNAGGGLIGGPPNILGISPDTGISSTDGITDVNRIKISGVAPQGETITVYSNGTPIGTTVADNNGNWTFDNTGTALADGTYVLTATATDPIGNVSALSLPYGVTIDTRPPAAPGIVGAVASYAAGSSSAITADSTPLVFGNAAPFSQVTLYSGPTILGSTAADPNGHWNITVPAGSLSMFGTLSFTATATDVAGNVSGLAVSYNITLIPPILGSLTSTLSSVSMVASSILGVNPDGSVDTGSTPTLSGAASALSQVAVFEDGVVIGVATAGLFGNWSYTTPTLMSGRHRLSIEAVNVLGVLSSAVDTLIIQV